MKSDALQYLIRASILTVAIILIGAPARAKRTCPSVLQSSAQLTAALISRDTVSIKKLVDPEIGYGHSNGWIETRDEMIRNLYNGTLQYHSIRLLDTPQCRPTKRRAIVRHSVAIEMKGVTLQMDLGVLQIWERRNGNWTLIARQSCKIP